MVRDSQPAGVRAEDVARIGRLSLPSNRDLKGQMLRQGTPDEFYIEAVEDHGGKVLHHRTSQRVGVAGWGFDDGHQPGPVITVEVYYSVTI